MRSTISSKGQITIPAALREALGLRAGTPVLFEERPGGAFLRKGGAHEHPVDHVYGRLRLRAGVDAILDAMRGPRPRPARRRTQARGR